MDGHDKISGLAGGVAPTTDYAFAQLNSQTAYFRQQAMTFALQANAGAPRAVAGLIEDAERIMAWLQPKSNSATN